MTIASIATYRPAWTAGGTARVAGSDEDVVTMAIAVGREAAAGRDVERVILVSRQAGRLSSSSVPVVRRALDLTTRSSIEFRVGGSVALAGALTGGHRSSLVIGVEADSSDSAAAALIEEGDGLARSGEFERGAPAVHDPTGEDARFLRERVWRPAVPALLRGWTGAVVVAGLPARTGREITKTSSSAARIVDVPGAPAALFGIAAIRPDDGPARVLVGEEGSVIAIDVCGAGWTLRHYERPVAHPLPPAPPDADIPISVSGFERAFDSKIGLAAAVCECGAVSFPPRRHCLSCGAQGKTTPRALPRAATVYSVVTVRVPVPSKAIPYSIALVQLDDSAVRVLAPVTDVPGGSIAIGDRGRLVLRAIAVREGITDYGYAFQPEIRA